MIIKEITYKGYSIGSAYNILINQSNKGVSLRTEIYNKQNFHGSRTSYTLAEGRLFTIGGVIYWESFADRQIWVNFLNSIIKPEWIPNSTDTWFYELTWKDWDWNQYKTQAKVYRVCEFNHWVNEPIIQFTFELFSEISWYYWYTDQQVVWSETWNLAWVTLSKTLPFWLSTMWNWISVTNSWNFVAPCSIRVQWSLENPVIYNATTKTGYRLYWVTTLDLVIDNRWNTLVVTEQGQNATQYRWSGSTSIFLEPWVNEIYVFWDTPNPSLAVTIDYNHTYMGS